MSKLTCITCQVKFNDPELHREHYKSDWHRYNLKRKVAKLPSVTIEGFLSRLEAQQNSTEKKTCSLYCSQCQKNFSSQNSLSNHLNSKKHQKLGDNIENVKRKESDLIDGNESDEWEDVIESPSLLCLFCKHESLSLNQTLAHMLVSHSFFIPDVECVKDLEGLMIYLNMKVGVNFQCLWCGQRFMSLDAVHKHMLNKGHTKLFYEDTSMTEYEKYYDYGDVSFEQEYAEADIGDANDVDYQLVLPSGNTVGHRSFIRYYR